MSRGTVLIRVDGLVATGMGRLARCLALANALQRRRYQMIFLSRVDTPHWPDRIRRFRHHVRRLDELLELEADQQLLLQEIQDRNPTMVITDHPVYDEQFLAMLSNRVPLVLTLDEEARQCYPSDLVLNPTLGCEAKEYRYYPGTQVLSGRRYAMVRSEFRRARNVRATEPGGARRILLALGGGLVLKPTFEFAKAMLQHKEIEKIDAVLGSDTSNREALEDLARRSNHRLHLITDSRDLAIRMTKSHLLVTGGGNTALEGACVGIPMVLVNLRPDTLRNAQQLDECGCAHYLGSVDRVEPGRVAETVVQILNDDFDRRAMARSGRRLIDGRGADRLVTASEVLLCRSHQNKSLQAA